MKKGWNEDGITLIEYRLSYVIIVLVLIFSLVVALFASIQGVHPLHIVAEFAILGIFLLTYSISFRVDDNVLYLKWGIGLLREEIALAGIESFRIVANRYVSIWPYNPWSDNVLEIRMRSGELHVLPISDPKGLMEMLNLKQR